MGGWRTWRATWLAGALALLLAATGGCSDAAEQAPSGTDALQADAEKPLADTALSEVGLADSVATDVDADATAADADAQAPADGADAFLDLLPDSTADLPDPDTGGQGDPGANTDASSEIAGPADTAAPGPCPPGSDGAPCAAAAGACQFASCQGGQCVTQPVADATPCAGTPGATPSSCTFGPACLAGQCVDELPLPDGLACGPPPLFGECTKLVCLAGKCAAVSNSAVPCCLGKLPACHAALCSQGQCISQPLSGPACAIEGYKPCHAGQCKDGNCQWATTPGAACALPDFPDCQEGVCDATGACTAVDLNGVPCPLMNGDPCLTGMCLQGKCSGVPVPDGKNCGKATEPCTTRQCVAGICETLAVSNTQCTPANPCEAGSCVNGACIASPKKDGASCGGPVPPCGQQVCLQGACTLIPRPPGSICLSVPGKKFNGDCEACDGLACVPNPPMEGQSCAPDECSVRTCQAGVCQFFSQKPTGAQCISTKNGPCTGISNCVGGVCPFKPLKCPACTSCDSAANQCVASASFDGSACDDGDVCTTAVCQAALCVPTGPADCDDKNPCTDDSCDKAQGCQYEMTACDDADPCTVDSCAPAGDGEPGVICYNEAIPCCKGGKP